MVGTLVAALVLGAPQSAYRPTGHRIQVNLNGGRSFVITTDPKNYPKTTARITELVKQKFYDGQRLHRVEDWVVQWGDPVSRTDLRNAGRSGSGKQIPFEGGLVPFDRGTVGIASTGRGVGGDSQLFIVKRDSKFLQGDYAVLGMVTSGMNVVDGIKQGDTIVSMTVLAKK